MFTRQEASRLKQEFWTVFGRYMRPVLSADGSKVNWVNYHTRVKGVYFRMEAGNRLATISISVEHTDAGMRELYFQQFAELKNMLEETVKEQWTWELAAIDEHGRIVSRIYSEMPDVSVLNRDDWPALISFFKRRIIALDAFWNDARYAFEALQ
jgi:hypothetical protein